ncbi:nickel transporter [Thermithiobacillus plumbiphilus]|uniref:Nickel/cobalt efflux system n=1 Tax=Thermithiobacillus plumbiphilus TaxID=1729899 RepID=A0ABU9D4P7_9PROT
MDFGAHGLWAWLGLVFALGLRHGIDPDHLASIDALTRLHADTRPRLARRAGLYFALGHGLVVTLVAVLVSTLMQQARIPGWFEGLGIWSSVILLTVLGSANIWNARRGGQQIIGLKSRLFAPLLRVQGPGAVILVGALFALAFDTLSQTAVWTLAAGSHGQWAAALLGLSFTLGMVLPDGLNGRLLAGLLRRNGSPARAAGFVVGLISLAMAAFEAYGFLLPRQGAWMAGREWLLSLFLLLLLPLLLLGRRSENS